MLHLVRNAVSHGVEAPAGRRAADKAETGTIWISASQQAGRIQVEVRDDGAGLDLEALRRKGIAHGLLPPGVALDDPAVRDLVFASGMSTRDGAAEVAGRGVGCDVVKRTIERLGGTVRVESEAGAGTCFRITLPLTLAITRAVLVAHGAHRYAVPLHFAERVLDTSDVEVVESAGQRRLLLEGESIRVHRLAEHLALGGGEAAGPIVLVRTGEQLVGVQVEAVIGQEEVVVKSLGYVLDGHPLLSGVTMRGSGELVFILDVQGFADTAAQLAAPLLAEPAGALSAASAPALRVLWVDDSLSVRRVAERILEQLGAEVVLAVDGIDAMDKLRAGRFDMVFTDLEMPRRSGYELIAELRYLPSYQHLPIVVVSSRSGAKHVAQARAAGASGFLGKPFTEESVAAMLREHLGRDGRSDAPGAARPAASAAPERQCHGTGPARARGGEP
jgi:chemosensory pili system protein ChpA (sensor histidine kinase/response regulator)